MRPQKLLVLCSNMFTDYRAGMQLHMQVFKDILKSLTHVVFPRKKRYTKNLWLPFSLYCVHGNRFQKRHPEARFFESVIVKN